MSASAQISQAWVARYNNGITNGTNQAVKVALDSAGNVIVAGFSQNTNDNLGYVTIKYAPNGNQLWAVRYDSTNDSSAMPQAMALDKSNNVIVTGNALTIKYDTNGNELWTAPYAGSALAVDINGNVAITGFGTSFNSVEINPAGTNLWEKNYSASCGAAVGQAISADTTGDIYVAGSYPYFCEGSLIDYELLIVKYDTNGSQLWTTTYQIEGGGTVEVQGAMTDSNKNMYLAASFGVNPDYVLKFNNSGVLAWATFLNQGAPSQGLVIDKSSHTIVTGPVPYKYTGTFSYYYGTFSIDTNGNPLWTNIFPQPPSGSSVANAIAVDQANNCYVTGYSSSTSGTNSIVTIKHSPSGSQLWLQSYNGLNAGNDAGNAIAVDTNYNVYITGYESLPGGGTGIVTIKYIPISIQPQTNGTVMIEASGSPGEMFDIEASTNLQTWFDLGTVTADTNGLMQFDDTNAVDLPFRFYYTKPQ